MVSPYFNPYVQAPFSSDWYLQQQTSGMAGLGSYDMSGCTFSNQPSPPPQIPAEWGLDAAEQAGIITPSSAFPSPSKESKPSEFKRYSNHEFHKLLDRFQTLTQSIV